MEIIIKTRSAYNGEVQNKSIKLRDIDIINYPKVIFQDVNGYQLQSEDGKIQYSQWRNKGTKKMTEITISSPYWKAHENLEIGDVFEIMGEGTSRPFPTKEDPNNIVWDFQLKNGLVEKSCRLNNKILKDLKAEFGADMGAWIGKEIEAKEMNKLAKGFQIVWAIVKTK